MVLQSVRTIGFVLFLALLHVTSTTCFIAEHRPRDLRFASTRGPLSSFPTVIRSFELGRIEVSATSDHISGAECGKDFPPAPRLTVLLPAYNEVKRIGETLDSYQSYLSTSKEWRNKSQILVVDDGSDDGTADFVRCDDWKQDNMVGVTCISLPQNEGKGAAVSFGIDHLVKQCGDEPCLVLIADADGSGDIFCLSNMTNALGALITSSQNQPLSAESFWNVPAIMNGYRGYEGSSLPRSILRWGFRTTVRVLCGDLRVRDSQCGMKLLTLAAARQLYVDLNLRRWSHDVEVLYRAREWNMSIAEQAVPWQDKEGSKLVESSSGTVQASAIMFMEVLRMRLEYALGRWKL